MALMDTVENSVKTQVQDMFQYSGGIIRENIFDVNRDHFSGFQWIASMDYKTCLVCADLDGKIWTDGPSAELREGEETTEETLSSGRPSNAGPDTRPEAGTREETGTQTPVIEEAVNTKLGELRAWGKSTGKEQAVLMTRDGKELGSAKGGKDSVTLSQKMWREIDKQPKNSLLLMHNHPSNTSFSDNDFDLLGRNSSIRELHAVGTNGKTYRVSIGGGQRPSLADMRKFEAEIRPGIKQRSANMFVRNEIPKGENMASVYLSERNKAFAEKYGWEYREGRLND